MKKIYLLVMAIAAANYCIAADIITSFTHFDLTQERMNATYYDSQNEKITFSTNQPSQESFYFLNDVDNPLVCANEPAPSTPPVNGRYTKIGLKGINTSTSPENSPYFIIGLEQESAIKEIKLMGFGGGANPNSGSEILYAFSKTGTNEADFFLPDSEDPFDETGHMYLKNQTCNYDDAKITIPEGTRYIKCIVTYQYFQWSISLSTPTLIQAIRFFAEEKVPTAIDHEQKQEMEIKMEGGKIVSNQPADISIYNAAGNMIKTSKHTKETHLENIPDGLYIIRAVSIESGHVYVKKISLVK